MDTDDLIATTWPMIGTLGAAFYFVPETLAVGKSLGLDGFRFYFLGRGGVLGDVEARVVGSAFGYFEPSLVARIWDSGKERADPRAAGQAYLAASAAFGRRHLAEVPGLERVAAALDAVNEAADPAGLALYAGVSAEPLVDDPPGRVMQLTTVLRELRGSAHLVAVRAGGLSPRVAHYLKRPGAYALFGWSEEDPPQVTEADRAAIAAADRLTDDLVRPAFAVLDGGEAEAVTHGLRSMMAALPTA